MAELKGLQNKQPLWSNENTWQFLEWIHNHREAFNTEGLLPQLCEEAANSLPLNPRTGRKYTKSEVRTKLNHLRAPRSGRCKKVTLADIAKEGKDCFNWRPWGDRQIIDNTWPRQCEFEREQEPTVLDEKDPDSSQLSIASIALLEMHNSVGDKSALPLPTLKNLAEMEELSQDESHVAPNFQEYLTLESHTYDILDTEVVESLKDIRATIKIIISRIFRSLDIRTLPYPQWDLIQMRCPDTSTLVHLVLGLSEKGALSKAYAELGLGRISLVDWITALIGAAVYSWVFRSDFPLYLTAKDKSLEIMKSVLAEKGLHILSKNIFSDVRFRLHNDHAKEIELQATRHADRLAAALEPMFIRHDIEDPHIGAPNASQNRDTWMSWRICLTDMFAKCLRLKAKMELDSGVFHFRWPKAGTEFKGNSFEPHRNEEVDEGRMIYTTQFPAVVVPTRNNFVLWKGTVVLQ